MKKIKSGDIVIYGILTVAMIIVCIPFYMMINISLDQSSNQMIPFPPRLWPKEMTLFNYDFIFKDFKFTKYFLNTLQICIGSVAVSVGSALLAGYAFSKLEFPFKKGFFMLALATMMIPSSVLMVPSYMIIKRLGLYDTYWAFYLPAVVYAFGAFFVKQFMDGLPDSLGESAKIDGASEVKIFNKIYIPLCGPIIATMVILQFMGYYNDLYGPLLYLKSRPKFNLPFAMAMYNSRMRESYGVMFALAALSTLPIMTIFLFFQRYIVESIAVTGIKQ